MEEQTIEAIDPVTLQFLEYNGAIALIALIALAFTIIYSAKNGGIREIFENLLLWFLLFGGVLHISSYPVDGDDQITGAIFFVAFGLCRIAKHIVKKEE